MLKPSLNSYPLNLNFVKDEILRIVVSLVLILLAYGQVEATNYYFFGKRQRSKEQRIIGKFTV